MASTEILVPADTVSENKVYTVSELTKRVRELLEGKFAEIWLEGEVSNFRAMAASGHYYFSLKDSQSQIRAVMFKGAARVGLRFDLADGMQVLAYGRLSVYEPRGEYQLVVERLEPQGLGALQLAFEQLKAKLQAEGLFDAARKRPIPASPSAVAVITSPTGAVIQDILNVSRRRCPWVNLVVLPVRVQGEGSAAEIVAALEYAGENLAGEVQTVVLARGGGSLEDLWSFNEEAVARAIAACPVPVISAVGHEVDFTIADFTADLRAPTPSAAAELMSLGSAQLKSSLEEARARMRQTWQLKASAAENSVNFMADRLRRAGPLARLQQNLQKLDDFLGRLHAAQKGSLRFKGEVLAGLKGKLEALNPLAILKRGYAAVFTLPGRALVKNAGQAVEGADLEVLLGQGRLRVTVKSQLKGADHG